MVQGGGGGNFMSLQLYLANIMVLHIRAVFKFSIQEVFVVDLLSRSCQNKLFLDISRQSARTG